LPIILQEYSYHYLIHISQKYPGKPRSQNEVANLITLSWDTPSKFCDEHNNLTAFIFHVRVVYEGDEGSYRAKSDERFISSSPASRIVQASILKENGNPTPSKYALPITEMRQARNEKAKTKKFELGTC
jgi:hypothetical protein